MFAKIVTVVALAVAVCGQADRFPAGVDPRLCPNFPICDNTLLATYNPVPGAAPRYLPAPVAPVTHQSAAQYPAGVSPASCPNYPYCNVNPAALSAPPLPGFSERLYPAGVNPAVCPNFPYCH